MSAGPGADVSAGGASLKLTRLVEDFLRTCKVRVTLTPSELLQQARSAETVYRKFDADGNGTIDINELQRMTEYLGDPTIGEEAEMAQKQLDKDGNGVLDLSEWVSWWLLRVASNPNPDTGMRIAAERAFDEYDQNGDGALDIAEIHDLTSGLATSLGFTVTDEELKEMMDEIDTDADGRLDREEFLNWWQGSFATGKLRQLRNLLRRQHNVDLHTAVWEGDTHLVATFLDADMPPDAPDMTVFGAGYTPLHYAAYQGHAEICRMLVQAGARLDAVTDANITPLFLAAQQGHIDLVRMFLANHAQRNSIGLTETETGRSFSVLDVATHPDIRAAFAEHEWFTSQVPPGVEAELQVRTSKPGELKMRFPPLPALPHADDPSAAGFDLPITTWVVLVHAINAPEEDAAQEDDDADELRAPPAQIDLRDPSSMGAAIGGGTFPVSAKKGTLVVDAAQIPATGIAVRYCCANGLKKKGPWSTLVRPVRMRRKQSRGSNRTTPRATPRRGPSPIADPAEGGAVPAMVAEEKTDNDGEEALDGLALAELDEQDDEEAKA